LAVRRGPEAAAGAHRAVDLALPVPRLHDDLDPCSEARPVRLDPLELQLEPVVAVARVGEELVVEVVPVGGAAHHRVYVLGAVVVEVGKAYPVALLELP